MTADDIEASRTVQALAMAGPGDPTDPSTFPPDVTARQQRRINQFLTHDPGGAWVAASTAGVIGVALALRRGDLWGLSLLAVRPDRQANGIGRRLLDATLTYAVDARRAVIVSTSDPKAMACYAGAGFDLHPQVAARGPVRRLAAVSSRVRDGGSADVELAEGVDAVVRGARRGPDQLLLAETWQMFVVDDGDGRGYAYVRQNGEVEVVAATDETTASALLWRCLAYAADKGVEASVEHANAQQQWATRVMIEAGLSLRPSGPVFWRGAAPPPCYLPSGPWL